MESQTRKSGIPDFARDDVAIVLDELCAGYDAPTELRMRKELFDHYRSAFDDAVGEGLGEEDAHEKVLQDLGWETTLMVGEVCKGMGKWGAGLIRYTMHGRSRNPMKELRLFSFISVIVALFLLKSTMEKDWVDVGLAASFLLFVMGLIPYTVYRMKAPSQRSLLRREDILKRINRGLRFELIIGGSVLMASIILYQWFPENKLITQQFTFCPMYMIATFIKYAWLKKQFWKAWSGTFPQDRIF